jgi:hypothetical protein
VSICSWFLHAYKADGAGVFHMLSPLAALGQSVVAWLPGTSIAVCWPPSLRSIDVSAKAFMQQLPAESAACNVAWHANMPLCLGHLKPAGYAVQA